MTTPIAQCAHCRSRAAVRPATRVTGRRARPTTAPICRPCAAALLALAGRFARRTGGWSVDSLTEAWFPTTRAA